MALGNSGLPTSAITTDTSKTPRATMGGGGAAPTINGSSGVARPASVVKPSQQSAPANQYTDTGGATGTRANPGVTPASMPGATKADTGSTGARFIPASALEGMQNAKTTEQINREKQAALREKQAALREQNPGPGSGGIGGGSSPAASASSSPSVDTGYDPYAAENAAAAATTSRIVNGIDMSEKIAAANDAWSQATQNYGQQSGQLINQYGQGQGQNINQYGNNANNLTNAYSSAVNQAANNYTQQSNANTNSYQQQAKDIISRLDTMTAKELSDYAAAAGQTVDEFLKSMRAAAEGYGDTSNANIGEYMNAANNIINQLSSLTGQQLADYAAQTGQTIDQATKQINDILNGLQENLKPAEIGRVGRVDTTEQENLLKTLSEQQRQQAEQQVDYATNLGVNELQRALEDAAPQFQAQRNQIAANEAQARDNQALYAEMRGDRGGIGQAQYDAIANTAATNNLKVQTEQTKLATDTARQIADLRAKGEFDKADKYLQISQEYLKGLMNLKQWAQEANIGIDEFNIAVDQWEQEFNSKIQQTLGELGIEATKYATDLGLNRQQYLTEAGLRAAENEANLGMESYGKLAAMRENTALNMANMAREEASSAATMRQNNQQYLTNQGLNAAQNSANLGMETAGKVASQRESTLMNTANMARDNAYNEAQMRTNTLNRESEMRSDLNKALADYGLSDARYMNENQVKQLTDILNAYQQNAQNMASTELAAANVTGAFSDKTQTMANREAQASRLAQAGAQMLAQGITPTDAQLKALGWSKDQYKGYKDAMEAAQAAAAAAASRRGGGGGSADQLVKDVQAMIAGGAPLSEINNHIDNYTAAGLASSASETRARGLTSGLTEGKNYHVSPNYASAT